MKNLFTSSFLFIFFISKINAQCPDNIVNQTDILNFKNNNCTEITGNVTIGSNITSVADLSGLTRIGGSLYITDAAELSSLGGLRNLQEIGSDLKIKGTELTSLSELSSLKSVGSIIDIDGNHSLNNIGWNIMSSGDIFVSSNGSLVVLDGLNSIQSISGLYVNNNPKLTTIGHLSATSTLPSLNLYNNSILSDLTGLSNIKQINDLYISDNPNLKSLDGLGSLETVEFLSIYNTGITDLYALSSLKTIESEVTIQRNPNLSTCDIKALCNLMSDDAGAISISDNAPNSPCEDNAQATIACTAKALPIELSYFNGKIISNTISLKWSTATELNNSHFEIERSNDGINFKKIGEVLGHGTTNSAQFYGYTDIQPIKGTNYYRLKQVDYDHKFSYSSIISFTFQPKDISVYPNPTKDFVQVTTDGQSGVIELKDGMGKAVISQNFNENATLNLSSLPHNFYYLVIKTDTQTITKKIVKE